ncbi:restriction endonuclease subunit S [Candidatus Chloroploca sp. M-50]|uniref:Restriction endonuclease subunit S n=1 Tax=Candidatus Chloroploca mongolica TaxID=2528176 RepID=A0ABS4DAK0_9CHLR|nr:restriction endonuclease subunit S [Candidatus Chloroploca mongolica]MBP1466460.1 restriction endonuclease subunit S [Candidatus Chloroploca mongolica]
MSNDSDTNDMTYEPTRGLTPRLRFAEFHGDWEYQKLNDIAFIITEKAGSSKYTLMSITTGVGLVSQMEKFGREIAGEQYKNYFVIREHDFAYNKSATKEYPEGFIAMYSGEEAAAVPNSIFTCFRVRAGKVIPQYLSYLFLGNLHGRWLRNFITVGARAHGSLNVDNADLLSLQVPMPQGGRSLEEQQRIADCLASLDELIAAQSQKHDALKAHKSGLLQQLFPAEGETTPRLRFAEFRDAGEWEVKPLGEVATFYNGRAYKQEELLEQGKYKVLRVGNFFTNNSWYYSDLELDETKYCEKGDLLYAWSASFGPRIWHGEKVIYHYHIWKVVMKDNISRDFLSTVLSYQTEKIKSQSANGLGLLHITKGTIEGWKCSFPSLPEQQRIAAFLTSLDDLIAAQTQKLDALKVHKKGMLQQLFPSIDEEQG